MFGRVPALVDRERPRLVEIGRNKVRQGAMFDTLPNMAFWTAQTPDGRSVVGTAADEREARMMIDKITLQDRASVTWRESAERWRWTVVVDGSKTSHGWADTEAEAWADVREVIQRPYRGTHQRAPRGLFSMPPA
jgi:hypothetical protein